MWGHVGKIATGMPNGNLVIGFARMTANRCPTIPARRWACRTNRTGFTGLMGAGLAALLIDWLIAYGLALLGVNSVFG